MSPAQLGAMVAAVVLLYVVYRCLPLLYDYRFSEKGIEIVVGRVVTVFRIRREDIVTAEIRKPSNPFLDWRRPFAVALGNRFTSKPLAVKTSFRPRHWYFTPADPDDAIRRLGLSK
jgi:hypothetical protein